jgi:hypothetical protein
MKMETKIFDEETYAHCTVEGDDGRLCLSWIAPSVAHPACFCVSVDSVLLWAFVVGLQFGGV